MNSLISEEVILELDFEESPWVIKGVHEQLKGFRRTKRPNFEQQLKNGIEELQSRESLWNFTPGHSEFAMLTAIQVKILCRKL